ncbi:hypothetical protein [Congregibacter sp.]|uniref:hypothetical protein n=1 Tax=Congregibacter sp. TaxID=2744308 RepID=UPI003F6C04C4
MSQTKERDAEIGQDFYLQLRRITERLAKRHGIELDRAADYLLAGSVFTAADIYEASIDDTVEVIREIAASVQVDEFPAETRH